MTLNEIAQIIGENNDVKEVQEIVNADVSKSERMRRLYKLELEVPEIAKLLDTSYNFVYNVIRREYGEVRTTRRGDSKSQKFRDMYDKGMAIGEIAKATNSNYNQVWQVIDAHRKKLELEEAEESNS